MNNRKKNRFFLIGIVSIAILTILGITYKGLIKPENILESYHMIAYPYEANWVSRSTFETQTYEEQIEELKNWIDNLPKDEDFFIEEEFINSKEVEDTYLSQYLFENCNAYNRAIKKTTDSMSIVDEYVPKIDLDQLDNTQQKFKTLFVRKTFYVDKNCTLNITTEFDMNKGKLAIGMISPTGDKIEIIDMVDNFNNTKTIPIGKGIWSIIYSFELDKQGKLEGEKSVIVNLD